MPPRVSSSLVVLGFWLLGAAPTEGSGRRDPEHLTPPSHPQSYPENTGVKPTEADRAVRLTDS